MPVGSTFDHKHTHLWNYNPKYQCYLNSVIQLLLQILRTINHNFHFASGAEGSLSKCLFETTHNVSNYVTLKVDALKFWLVHLFKTCSCLNQIVAGYRRTVCSIYLTVFTLQIIQKRPPWVARKGVSFVSSWTEQSFGFLPFLFCSVSCYSRPREYLNQWNEIFAYWLYDADSRLFYLNICKMWAMKILS